MDYWVNNRVAFFASKLLSRGQKTALKGKIHLRRKQTFFSRLGDYPGRISLTLGVIPVLCGGLRKLKCSWKPSGRRSYRSAAGPGAITIRTASGVRPGRRTADADYLDFKRQLLTGQRVVQVQ
jgi:hypothetical protein